MRNRVAKTTRPLDPGAARFRAMRLLERRPQSERELTDKLRRRGFDPGVVEATIGKLKELGLLNDEAYAAAVVRDALAGRPVGGRRLVAKLQARGVDRKLAAAATDAALADRDVPAMAAQAVSRFLAGHPSVAAALKTRSTRFSPELAKARQKLYAFLARRGFDGAVVSRAVRAAGVADPDD